MRTWLLHASNMPHRAIAERLVLAEIRHLFGGCPHIRRRRGLERCLAMGLFRKREPDWPVNTDPVEAIRIAQQALAARTTYIDEHGRRRKVTPAMRAHMQSGLDSAMRAQQRDS